MPVALRRVAAAPWAGLEIGVVFVSEVAEPGDDAWPRYGAEARRPVLVGLAAVVVDVRGDDTVAEPVEPVVDASPLRRICRST